MEESLNRIDFVIPWVDGADPVWRAEREEWAVREPYDPFVARWNDGEQRYRDWGLLKYWFRGVEKFAPWVGKIHFLTWGHVPEWLNTDHPKIHVVNHHDYIPAKWLPTFSSHCIELNVHRIRGLSSRFVYFNDDTFLTAPVEESDFFRDGLPCDAAIISPIHLRQNGVRAEINAMYAINGNFRKRDVILSSPLKWFSPRYGLGALTRTLTQLPYRLFTGFYVHHMPVSYLKTSFENVWGAVPEILERACAHRFRDERDVNQWLVQYWQYCTGKFAPRSPSCGAMFEGRSLLHEAAAAISSMRRKMICWNDSSDISPEEFPAARDILLDAMKDVFQERSPYEKG